MGKSREWIRDMTARIVAAVLRDPSLTQGQVVERFGVTAFFVRKVSRESGVAPRRERSRRGERPPVAKARLTKQEAERIRRCPYCRRGYEAEAGEVPVCPECGCVDPGHPASRKFLEIDEPEEFSPEDEDDLGVGSPRSDEDAAAVEEGLE